MFDDFEDWAYEEYFGFDIAMREEADPAADATAAEDEAAADTEDEAAAGAEDEAAAGAEGDAESEEMKDEKAEAKDAKN